MTGKGAVTLWADLRNIAWGNSKKILDFKGSLDERLAVIAVLKVKPSLRSCDFLRP